MQKPGRGSIRLLGQELTELSAGARDTFRVDHTGYIFQQFNLLPFLSVRENVELPCHFSKLRAQRAKQRHGSVDQAAATLLAHLGLKDESILSRRADSLSIGQQQRVAAARALIGQPELVIADEPTSALDYDARENFIRLLFAECREAGSSLLFVSHDQSLAPLFDRHLSLAELNRAAASAEV
ncbi:ABC transporter ATP-binding protein YtrE [compost metagenome]